MPSKYLSKWEPFRDLVSMRTNLDRIFESFFGTEPRITDTFWAPVVDIVESNGNIEVKAEIPGMTKDDINVSVQNNVLKITGERKQENEKKEKTYHIIERSYGKFERNITLPADVDAEKIRASYKDGVLHVLLPKPESLKPKEIDINVN